MAVTSNEPELLRRPDTDATANTKTQDKNASRIMNVPGVPNFRDVGGYPIADDPTRQVRRGVVYRCAAPEKIDAATMAEMKRLKIATVFDLRFESESKKHPSFPNGNGITTLLVPVFPEQEFSVGSSAVQERFEKFRGRPESFADAYTVKFAAGTHPDNTAKPFARILEHLASKSAYGLPPTPILIHCQSGKDRTAVICALILSLCGVSDDVVAEEYSLSDLGLQASFENMMNAMFKKHEMFRRDPEGTRRMVLCNKENMLSWLRKLRDDHGSVVQAVINAGLLTKEGVENLRRNMVVDVRADEAVSIP